MSRGPVLHHPGPLRLRGLPDATPAGVSRRCAPRGNASPPAALLRQVCTVGLILFPSQRPLITGIQTAALYPITTIMESRFLLTEITLNI